MVRTNPNSPIRSGYKYEDLFVLKLCVDWLKNPDKFQKIQIQYTPEGLIGFAIDDVVVTLADGTHNYYQLKYKQNPDTDFWNFNHLFDKGLLRWIDSYSKLLSLGVGECFFISNGHSAEDISVCIKNKKIELSKIKNLFPETYDKLFDRFKKDELLEKFFCGFAFEFSYAGKYDIEKELRITLNDDLNVTKAGIDSLLLFIADQGSERYPKEITLLEIRNNLSWDNPKPLNQGFRVPTDFELFDTTIHEHLVADLSNMAGGIKVITGKPGSGKSTYLSKLYTLLKKKNIIVSRHHYHLNPKDRSHRDRLNTDRVIEGLRADFKKQKSIVLGELAGRNTQHTPLKEFIQKISAYYSLRNQTFVLIIDGLDHVIREGQNEEDLKKFLHEILQPQKGYWLILGCQEMAVRCFPNLVYNICPVEKWIEIKGLNRSSVKKIVNKTLAVGQKRDHIQENISLKTHNELFNLTNGNPLHLRYVLSEIKTSGVFISSYDLKRIPAYKGDISEYYSDIWRQLSSLAKTFCYAITAIDFRLHQEQLFELASFLTDKPHDITEGFKEIEHLIVKELSGISVYHNSFSVFMVSQPELLGQRQLLYRSIRLWLKDCKDEELKWSETVKVEFELGNSDPILLLDKDWVISSYLNCKSESQILNLLQLAAKAAFEGQNIDKTVLFSVLARNFEQRVYNLWDNLQKIWVTAFNSKPAIKISYPDFSKCTHYQLKELIIALKEKGVINTVPEEARDRIIELAQESEQDGLEIIKSWIEVQMYFEDVSDSRILQLIRRNQRSPSTALLSFYVGKLLDNKARFSSRIGALLNLKLTKKENDTLAHAFIEEDLLHGKLQWSPQVNRLLVSENIKTKLYRYLETAKIPIVGNFRAYSKFPDKYNYSSSRSNYLVVFLDQFYKAFYLSLQTENGKLDKFLSRKPKKWKNRFIYAVTQAATIISGLHKAKKRISLREVLSAFDDLEKLEFFKNHDIYEIRRAISPKIIDEIIWLSKVLNTHNEHVSTLNREDIDFLSNHELYYKSSFFEVLHLNHATLTDDGFSRFVEIEIENLAEELIPFTDKTERMANLAILAKKLHKPDDLETLLFKSAENILSYGNHKDMFLYDLLLSVEKCGCGGSKKVNEFLYILAPYVLQIEKLTDGDETGSFVYKFIEILARYDSQSLYRFYLKSLENRDYYLSENIFGAILENFDYSNRICFAVANTAVGNITYDSLKSVAEYNRVAGDVLNEIRTDLGDVDYCREDRNETKPAVNRNSKFDESYNEVGVECLENKLALILANSRFSKYEVSNYLFRWTQYWLELGTGDKSPIIRKLRDIITLDYRNIEAELLDFLYPFALELDRNFAFDCICWAGSNSSQWGSDYFSKPEDAKARWDRVKQDFPSRIDDFYRISLLNSGQKYGGKVDYCIPIPKSAQFYIDTNRLEIAESITQAYLKLLPVLFPNVKLPLPVFLNERSITVSPFDILLKRLQWMSPIVRERAANQLISLLRTDIDGNYHDLFFAWIKEIELESTACDSLMILLISIEHIESQTRNYIMQNNIGSLLSIRCMATDLIQVAIAERLGLELKFSIPLLMHMIFARPNIEEEAFKKIVGTNVPVSYIDNIEALQKDCPIEIWSAWYNIYKARCERFGLEYSRDDERYCNDFNSIMPGRITVFGDLLRSTFFQLLDYLHSEGFIGFDDLFYFTLKNFTVEPSSLRRKVATKPHWWPSLLIEDDSKIRGKLNIEIKDLLQAIPNKNILSLEGQCYQSSNFYHNKIFCSISLLGFAYRGDIAEIANPSEFYTLLSNFSGYWQPQMTKTTDFGVFNNDLIYQTGRNLGSDKLYISPLVSPVRSLNVNIWQYYRAFHSTRLLVPDLKNELLLRNLDTGLVYQSENEDVAEVLDFLDGLRDCSEIPEMIPYGIFTTMNSVPLKSYLSKKNLSIAYIVRKKWSNKEMRSKREGFTNSYEFEIFLPD